MVDIENLLRPLIDESASPPPMERLVQRARMLRWRRRRRWGAVSVVLVVLLGVGTAVLAGGGGGGSRIETPAHAPSGGFVPPTRSQGHQTVLPLTFLDGTTLDLVYPQPDRLAARGFIPGAVGAHFGQQPGGQPYPGRPIVVRYGQLSDFTLGAAPASTYPGVNASTVAYYEGLRFNPSVPNALGFQFGSWSVFVQDLPTGAPSAMSPGERATWAQSLDAHQTPDGFLILDPRPPLGLVDSDQPVGTLGHSTNREIALYFATCARPRGTKGWIIQRSDATGTVMCLPEAGLAVHLREKPTAAVLSANLVLQVRNVHPATVHPTTPSSHTSPLLAVLNAPGGLGTATTEANLLHGQGYTVVFVGNADQPQTGTTVACRSAFSRFTHAIAISVGPKAHTLPTPPNPQPALADCVITIGS